MKQDKLVTLKNYIKEKKKAAVAFSGGVDSTFLLKVCVDTLGRENVLAVLSDSVLNAKSEIKEAIQTAEAVWGTPLVVKTDEFTNQDILQNTPQRCYYCKKELFSNILQKAKQRGFNIVFDGTNADDLTAYRPGLLALSELRVLSPLAIEGFSKKEIRDLSFDMGLAVSNKPSSPCLATRIPYYYKITKEKLSAIAKGEELIKSRGILQCRLRHFGDTAKIEVDKENFTRVIHDENLVAAIKELGFTYVTLDLDGFVSGSMDKALRNH